MALILAPNGRTAALHEALQADFISPFFEQIYSLIAHDSTFTELEEW